MLASVPQLMHSSWILVWQGLSIVSVADSKISTRRISIRHLSTLLEARTSPSKSTRKGFAIVAPVIGARSDVISVRIIKKAGASSHSFRKQTYARKASYP